MQARFYDAQVGRFLSNDPQDFQDKSPFTFNRYSYANNNPYRYIDPTGMFASSPFLLAVVPGQASFDNAMTALESGSYLQAAMNVGVMLIEQAMTVTTFGESSGATTSARSAVSDSAQARAQQIHGAVPKAIQDKTTIAVTETKEGVRIISSSEMRLRPAQRDMLKPGEIEATGPGHAEVTGVNGARDAGLTPTATAASRPICENCATILRQEDVGTLTRLRD